MEAKQKIINVYHITIIAGKTEVPKLGVKTVSQAFSNSFRI